MYRKDFFYKDVKNSNALQSFVIEISQAPKRQKLEVKIFNYCKSTSCYSMMREVKWSITHFQAFYSSQQNSFSRNFFFPFLLSEHILCKESIVIVKKFDVEILTYLYVLRSPEFIYAVFTVMYVCMCVCMWVNTIASKQRIRLSSI